MTKATTAELSFIALGFLALLTGGSVALIQVLHNNVTRGYLVLFASTGVAVACLAFSLSIATNRRARERAELENRRAEQLAELARDQLEEQRAIRRRLDQLAERPRPS